MATAGLRRYHPGVMTATLTAIPPNANHRLPAAASGFAFDPTPAHPDQIAPDGGYRRQRNGHSPAGPLPRDG
jgi:hypothetical protein